MKHLSKISVLIFFMLVDPFFINAQDQSNSNSSSVFKYSGQIGLYGELYSISGKESRRPTATGRVFFRPTITLFNNFNINFDVLLSTDGSYARQQINRISLHPEWGWGKAHIGDFSHQFSNFTLNGETITGGGLELYPGIFRFEIVGGRTKRKVENGLYNSTYARYLAGVKLGIGKEGGSFFNINVIKAKDDISSLPRIAPGNSEIAGSARILTPKENLVVGINTNLNLYKLFNFSGEIAASVFTRDLNSSLIHSDKIPSFIDKIFKIRNSTNIDFAYRAAMKFNYDIANAGVSYLVINPGYQSLGLNSNINDNRSITANAGIILLKKKLTLRGNYRFQNNNLLSQKQFTVTRTSFGLSARFQPIRKISISINTLRNIMKNDAQIENNKMKNVVSVYSINTLWQLSLLKMSHSLSISYSQQESKNINTLRGYYSISKNINVGFNTIASKYWTIGTKASFNIVNITNRMYQTTQSYSLMVMNRMLRSRLSNSLTFSFMNSSNIQSIIFALKSSFKISKSDVFKLTLRSSLYFGKLVTVRNFKEYLGTLTFIHRF